MSATDSYFLEDRSQPLVNQNSASLNDRLLTQYIDVPEDDTSFRAYMIRRMANLVGSFFTPKQVLAILRLLKAITLCFIVLTILANLMYIMFVEISANALVRKAAGGNRDTFIRMYGLAMSFVALAIEVDYTKVVKRFSGLKSFIPRAMFYLFIAIITASHPVVQRGEELQQENNDNNNNNNGYNDEGNDNEGNGDDTYASAYREVAYDVAQDIPSSAVSFQMVSSFILGCCAMTYLFCGILCFDRFTALAFISTKDPRITTAVPATKQSTSSIGEGTPSQMMKAQTEFETDPEDYQPPPSEDLARRNDTPGYRSDPPAWH